MRDQGGALSQRGIFREDAPPNHAAGSGPHPYQRTMMRFYNTQHRFYAGIDLHARTLHLGLDPFVYLREALPGLFALGEKPTTEQLLEWLPDRWLLRRGRESPRPETRV